MASPGNGVQSMPQLRSQAARACGGRGAAGRFSQARTSIHSSIGNPEVEVPCCGAPLALSALGYNWPVGFARFEVCAMNPTRARYELNAEELAHVGSLLGHPVMQILAHY
jgi:hypothetical protein